MLVNFTGFLFVACTLQQSWFYCGKDWMGLVGGEGGPGGRRGGVLLMVEEQMLLDIYLTMNGSLLLWPVCKNGERVGITSSQKREVITLRERKRESGI